VPNNEALKVIQPYSALTNMKKVYIFLLLLSVGVSAGAQKRSKYQVINFLNSISGKKTLSGTHNNEPNAEPALRTN